MRLSLTKQTHDTLRPCDNNRLLPNGLQRRSGTVARIKCQLIITAIEDMICWKPHNLILVLLIVMAKRPNYTWNILLQAEGTHFTKITHSLFSVKDAMNYKVLHCVPVYNVEWRGFNFFQNRRLLTLGKPQAFDPWKTEGF